MLALGPMLRICRKMSCRLPTPQAHITSIIVTNSHIISWMDVLLAHQAQHTRHAPIGPSEPRTRSLRIAVHTHPAPLGVPWAPPGTRPSRPSARTAPTSSSLPRPGTSLKDMCVASLPGSPSSVFFLPLERSTDDKECSRTIFRRHEGIRWHDRV